MPNRPTNRLSAETSPYLLQHQHNPVDWHAWGDEAFDRARAEDRPILLSIGYSACHWCHVMERESFEDEQTAALMNERFVNVKVDREERPDVDSLYMTAVQRMTGHGGWPMTVFITPGGEPFYGGTYFPPQPRHGLPSFRQVLLGVSEAWRERRDEVRRSADELTSMLREATELRPPAGTLDPSVLDRAAEEIVRRHDRRSGGFGGAPKFPQPLTIEFLLRYWHRTRSEDAFEAVVHTLRWMARGGIYDHVGGGFHRYSVDAKWLVPHFEKMLYDNALLSRVYLHAYLATADEELRQVVQETLDYVLREMTSNEGGFYSAQDADSEGEEGKFYVWSPDEIDAALGAETGARVQLAYGATPDGNFEGKSILNLLPRDSGIPSREWDENVASARAEMVTVRDRLYEARARRTPPGLDDKVLTAWNAMMIRSLAEAGRALDRAEYVDAAVRGASFLRRELWGDGGLRRTHRAGTSKIPAFLDDHALLVDALVSLYQATFDPQWVAWAGELAGAMLERFWSEEETAFYDAAADSGNLVVRPREMNDSATPSGTSAAATCLLRLGALTGDTTYTRVVESVLEPLGEVAQRFPQAFGELLTAIDLQVNGIHEVAVVGEPGREDTSALLDALRTHYLPAAVTAFRSVSGGGATHGTGIPLLEGREMVNGAAAAYVCRRFTCERPVASPQDLLSTLQTEPPAA